MAKGREVRLRPPCLKLIVTVAFRSKLKERDFLQGYVVIGQAVMVLN